jgi:hypothetical protein
MIINGDTNKELHLQECLREIHVYLQEERY